MQKLPGYDIIGFGKDCKASPAAYMKSQLGYATRLIEHKSVLADDESKIIEGLREEFRATGKIHSEEV